MVRGKEMEEVRVGTAWTSGGGRAAVARRGGGAALRSREPRSTSAVGEASRVGLWASGAVLEAKSGGGCDAGI